MEAASRETAGATTTLIVRYVRRHAGDDGVARLLALAGETRTAAELEDEHRWSTYEQKLALFDAAAEVLGDPHVTMHMGESALEHQVGAGLRVLLRALGSPRIVLANVAKACPKFSTVASMDAQEIDRNHAIVTYRLHDGYRPHRLDCELNIGLLRVIGPLFGLPPLGIEHTECQVTGAAHCVYRVSWSRRSRLPWRRSRRAHLEEQVTALAAQVESLQSTAADLVSSEQLETVLARIVARAATAVSATRYLLAVRLDDDRPMDVHYDGMTDADARALAADLAGGTTTVEDGRRIVIDVASARHSYGLLAAFYDEHDFFPHERRLLAAYARAAAAALDAASALDEARKRGATSDALLRLARALADLSGPDDVAAKLAEAVPAVLGAQSSIVMLWDHERDALSVRARMGWSADGEAFLDRLTIRPGDGPAIDEWLQAPEPRMVSRPGRGPFMHAVFEHLDVAAVAIVPIVRGGEVLGIVAAGFDTDQRIDRDETLSRCAGLADQAATAIQNGRLLEQIRHQALHDPLTGLPNRTLFEDHATRAMERAVRNDEPLTIVFVDLDRFKRINDGLGHEIGDAILVEVGHRVAGCVRAGDIVARIGGDEFTMLLHRVDALAALEIAERTRATLTEPFSLPSGDHVYVSASVGVASYPTDAQTYEDLVRNADIAMYRAKSRGRNNTQLYLPTQRVTGPTRIALEADLRTALQDPTDRSLWLAFQPEVELGSGRLRAVEALVRWRHPTMGELAPDQFLHLVHDGGLDAALDAWVLNEACHQLQLWEFRGFRIPRVAVNISASQCPRPELLAEVQCALDRHGVAPERLEIEITEDAAIDPDSGALEILRALRDLGVTLALDDFGVGHATFGFVRDLPIAKLKIDRSFLNRLDDHDRQSIVAAIVAMGDALGLEVLAEGVETAEQLAVLRDIGCPLGQGFLFGRPVPAEAVPDMVGRGALEAARAPRR
ncbi:MAG TPA: EAL domain-containing protein [Acidimicrobiia bacterium]|nr:EAL domain-containing protein [Acidimicrobiia bacterium]